MPGYFFLQLVIDKRGRKAYEDAYREELIKKRPPIGQTRITAYDGSHVTYNYFNHHDKTQQSMTLPVFDFIKRLIAHVPDRYFRLVRYYNWLSNRTRGQYLPFVYQSLNQIEKKLQALS